MIERILNKEKLQANVRAYEEKKDREHIELMERNLLEIKEYLIAIQNEMIEVSKRGKSSYTFSRYEDSFNKAYSEEIEYFFKSQGFKVNVTTKYTKDYSVNDIFYGFGSFNPLVKEIKYIFVISWEEDEY